MTLSSATVLEYFPLKYSEMYCKSSAKSLLPLFIIHYGNIFFSIMGRKYSDRSNNLDSIFDNAYVAYKK